jgi:hypothetical protein
MLFLLYNNGKINFYPFHTFVYFSLILIFPILTLIISIQKWAAPPEFDFSPNLDRVVEFKG